MSDFISVENTGGTVVLTPEITSVEVLTVPDPSPVEVLEIAGRQGPSGPPGEKGDRGDPGTAAPGTFYSHTQSAPVSTWVIPHGMGMYPNVAVVDSAGTQVEGLVRYVSAEEVQIDFAYPFAGNAYLS